MATKKVCDQCGEDLPYHYLEVRPVTLTAARDGDVTALDGSWNGGEFCRRDCLIESMQNIAWPHERPSRMRSLRG